MNKDQYEKLVPPKITGKNNEVEEHVICDTQPLALQKFREAANKLLDVNSWQLTAEVSGISAEFQLKNEEGKSIFGKAEKGYFIQIDIPGPGSKAGDGFDWVKIEEIIDQKDSNAKNELVGLKVRACSNPLHNEKDTAHFFTDEATSTFIIERKNKIIYSKYLGRNEVINSDTNTTDKIRNSLIGLAAKLGFSEIQWKLLIKGFLK